MNTETYRHSVSVAAVIENSEKKILCIQRADNGEWQIPGGILEKEESILDGLKREIHEEVGLDITSSILKGIYKNVKSGIVALVFHCRASGVPCLSDEVRAIAWHDPGSLAKIMEPVFHVRVADALDGNTTVHIRTHDGIQMCS